MTSLYTEGSPARIRMDRRGEYKLSGWRYFWSFFRPPPKPMVYFYSTIVSPVGSFIHAEFEDGFKTVAIRVFASANGGHKGYVPFFKVYHPNRSQVNEAFEIVNSDGKVVGNAIYLPGQQFRSVAI